MGLARYWDAQTLTSNLFRLATWIFLRLIPSPRVKYAVPVLYALYLGTWVSAPLMQAKHEPKVKSEAQEIIAVADDKDVKVPLENGDMKLTQATPKPLPHGTLSTIALSLPTSSLTLRGVALLINSFFLLCAADFLTRPTREPATSLIFTRVGAVDPDGAKVVVRWPEAEGDAVRLVWRQAPTGLSDLDKVWKNGPVVPLRNETDWVGVGRIGGLWPSTAYEYRLAYRNSTHLPYPENPISFRTFPDPRLTTGNHFKFVVSSCIMPNFPYLPFKGERIRGFDLLADYVWPSDGSYSPAPPSAASVEVPAPVAEESPDVSVVAEPTNLRSEEVPPASPEATGAPGQTLADLNESTAIAVVTPAPSEPAVLTPESASLTPESSIPPTDFMLLLGDFIYADVPSYGGNDAEAYRRLYRRTYASPSFRKVYERLPIFNMYDDHEIINNFAGQSNHSTEPFPNASSAFYTYNGQANYNPAVKGRHYYDFRYGDTAFFVLDTRLHRSGNDIPEDGTKTMLGDQQLSALYEWLDKVNTTTTFKFIISSVPFTSLWTHDAQIDSWAAYLDERDALLTVLGTVPNVFVLSGDRHEFAAIEFLGGKVVEFSTSPFSMFYVPIVRTLRSRSKRLAEKWVQKMDIDEAGQEVVRNELELVPEEQVLKYLPLGNYKWSAFEIDTTDRQKPTLKLDVVINGRTEWRHTIIGQPVTLRASNALGTQITRGLKGALNKMGLSPTKWF